MTLGDPEINRAVVESILARLVLNTKPVDEFEYDFHEIICYCGVRSSRRLSHDPPTTGRKYFGCGNDAKGCGYFAWHYLGCPQIESKCKMRAWCKVQERALVENENSTAYDEMVVHANDNVERMDDLLEEIERLKYKIQDLEGFILRYP
ncbi:hypothetical protein LINPERPRIM_LOCUS2021 [Linum perenne]